MCNGIGNACTSLSNRWVGLRNHPNTCTARAPRIVLPPRGMANPRLLGMATPTNLGMVTATTVGITTTAGHDTPLPVARNHRMTMPTTSSVAAPKNLSIDLRSAPLAIPQAPGAVAWNIFGSKMLVLPHPTAKTGAPYTGGKYGAHEGHTGVQKAAWAGGGAPRERQFTRL